MNAVTKINADDKANADTAALPFRAHTIFGVCEALGEDFGINPIWLRIPFAATVLISPLWSVVAYFALGLVVLGSRRLFPNHIAAISDASATQQPAANSTGEMSLAA